MKRVLLSSALLVVLIGTTQPTRAGVIGLDVLWYNGDGYGQNATANHVNSSGLGPRIYDDFNVLDPGGWDVTSAWSNNFFWNIWGPPTVTAAGWSIRRDMSEGDPGTIVAEGIGAATMISTGRHPNVLYEEFSILVDGISVHLAPGTYWLQVSPVISEAWNSTTEGANAVGSPPGNNGNSFSLSSSGDCLPLTDDFSMGVIGTVSSVPEPSTLVLWSLLGAIGIAVGWRLERTRALFRRSNKGILSVGSLVVCLGVLSPLAHAGVITQGVVIPNPIVLDFESASPGPISPTAALFSGFGMSDIGIQNPSVFTDEFGIMNHSSRALWVNPDGLSIVDPGALENAQTGDFWFIDFQQTQHYIGFGTHDAGSRAYIIEFFLGAASVGSVVTEPIQNHSDLWEMTFHNTDLFDRITVQQDPTADTRNVGFPLDNITRSVPEPSTFAMLVMGGILVGAGHHLRRRRRK